jgi:hypothetical protein
MGGLTDLEARGGREWPQSGTGPLLHRRWGHKDLRQDRWRRKGSVRRRQCSCGRAPSQFRLVTLKLS